MKTKYQSLLDHLKNLGSVAVAFSGGVDSTFLAFAAVQALGDKAIAYTVDSPYIPRWELDEAKALAMEMGIKHQFIQVGISESIIDNPIDRCYLCKKLLFTQIKEVAIAAGFNHVVDGSNSDDTKDYRPGMVALKELHVKSPLLENNLNKDEIRALSKSLGLSTHDKPAYACLLTRLPYDQTITQEALRRVEQSEVYLHGLGLKAVRVRSHGDLARIEVVREQRETLMNPVLMDEISQVLKTYGFRYVTIDLSGYSMGSFNPPVIH